MNQTYVIELTNEKGETKHLLKKFANDVTAERYVAELNEALKPAGVTVIIRDVY